MTSHEPVPMAWFCSASPAYSMDSRLVGNDLRRSKKTLSGMVGAGGKRVVEAGRQDAEAGGGVAEAGGGVAETQE